MEMNMVAVVMTLSLVAIALALSKKQNLGLEKDLIIGTFRAFIQLMVVGYILTFVFDADNFLYILLMIVIMIFVATQNAAKKGQDIPRVFYITFTAITMATIISLILLLGFDIIQFEPRFVIPISGMIIGNSMIAAAIALTRIKEEIQLRKSEIKAALALGATARQAAQPAIKTSIKSGLLPTIEGMKTIGLVQLPGMMTGAILAGADPLFAVKLQIMVILTLTASVSISCSLIGLMTYKQFFSKSHQLTID